MRATPFLAAPSARRRRGLRKTSVDNWKSLVYIGNVIKSRRHKGLKELFETGDSRRVRPDLKARALRRLDRLDAAERPAQANIPGFNFHPLRGKPQRYSIHVNGPWCITFAWQGADAIEVDLEQYH